jgi:hypothetical protein
MFDSNSDLNGQNLTEFETCCLIVLNHRTMNQVTPPGSTQNAYLVYDVEPADEFAGTTWGYAELPGKPTTAALGHPFAVSLQDLLLVSKRHLL